MKLQIDTTAKTIKVEGTVNLKDLYDALEKFLPEKEWEHFILEASTPWYGSPIITCGTSAGEYSLNQGVYNVQI